MAELSNKNPLLNPSHLPNGAVPFDLIKEHHFLPALKECITSAKQKVRAIADAGAPPTFANTIDALESSAERVDWIANVFFNLLGAETNDKLQGLALEIGPLLSAFSNDVILDTRLFQRVQAVYDQGHQLDLTTEQRRLLDNTYSDFVRNGALLDDDQKDRLREIDQRLAKLGPQYSENVLKATNEFELWLKGPEEISGLPESVLTSARAAATERGRPGEFLFTLQAPSFVPFLKFADHRPSREKITKAHNSRAFGGAHDNQPIILEVVRLRHERAKLLGYKNHAQFVLEKRMAETPDRVQAFLEQLVERVHPAAERELQRLEEFAESMSGPSRLQSWDVSYYLEKLKEKLFAFNEEHLRPYFKLEYAIEGVFELARRLYQLEFVRNNNYPTYHPDVEVYEVYQNRDGKREYTGLFYTDFFPRATKRDGAWATTFLEQGRFAGDLVRPHVSIVCNFTKSTPTQPSLLTFQEVQTLFHEFGHALHSLLSRCHYRTLAGTNVYWDFVELPSQILENWIVEKDGLDLFARHYQTGEGIPNELAVRIKESAKFMAGYYSLRQLNFAILDMSWHTKDPDSISSVPEFEDEVTRETTLVPKAPGTNFSCSFGHIFGGGYSAGYYSYKWAEVLDADAFEFFKETGIFNPETARRFEEHILSRGGTEHPMELYKRFRGREPDPEALLRRDGLI